MSIKFNVVQRGNPAKPNAPKKYYPSIQSSGRMSLYELAEEASSRSTLTPADMMAAVESILAIIPEQLARGNIVELGDFGNFWLRTTSDGAEQAQDVRGDQITSLLPRFNPGKRFKRALRNVRFEKIR
ncbi:MAG: HU family DNA-binding protein [Anaerolineales bacterium]|nr:MAG: HU family DNA-binding protein [Anaerolineales bacterium]